MAVYIIAEAGVNHNGDVNLAKNMVDCAKEAGCDCVKFQAFQADKIVTRSAEMAAYQLENIGQSESQYDMLKRLELSFEEFKEIKEYCDKKKIDFTATPFDEEAADWLEKIGVMQYKISSGEITNKPLLQHIARKGKRILLSTGMASMDEVREAVSWISETGNKNIVIFHCTSDYPAPYISVNMNSMIALEKEFHFPVGYSDHTEGNEISIMAVSLGAAMIEKHFTISKNFKDYDHKASLEPDELKKLVESIRNVEIAFGSSVKMPTSFEMDTRKVARKSLVFSRDVKKGEIINEKDIVCKRPGTGISPKYKESFVGKRTKQDCLKDTLIKEEWIETR